LPLGARPFWHALRPRKYATDEDAEVYALAVQEREDERGELLAAKKREAEAQRDPARGETCNDYRRRLDEYRRERGRYRSTSRLPP
jgi:hypothetical protein